MPENTEVLELLNERLERGALTVRQARQVAQSFGMDPDDLVIPCEASGCHERKPHGQMYSMWATYGMPGPGHSPYWCPSEQHYGCCHQHAKQALIACLEMHIETGHHGP